MKDSLETPKRPRPQPPEEPLPGDCCDSGCADCIFDQHGDALRAYERAVMLWEQEQLEIAKPDK